MEQLNDEVNILDNPLHGIYIPSALVVGGCSLLTYMSGEYRILLAFPILIAFLALRIARAYKRKRSIRPDCWTSLELEDQTLISRNTAIYRFKTKTSFESINVPTGHHLAVKVPIDGKDEVRYYTPITSKVETGYFDLIVKSYAEGNVSKYFAGLKPGSLVDFKGPVGTLNYEPNSSRAIGFVAGGSGITPALQVLNAIITTPEDLTKISLIYANETANDILLRDELDEMAAKYPNFDIHYVLNKPPAGWTGETGYVTKEMIEKYLPASSQENRLFVCGPDAMNSMVVKLAEEMGWRKDDSGDSQLYVF